MGVDTRLLILGYDSLTKAKEDASVITQMLSEKDYLLAVHVYQDNFIVVQVSLDIRWRSRHRAWNTAQKVLSLIPDHKIVAINNHEHWDCTLHEFLAGQHIYGWEPVDENWVKNGAAEQGTVILTETQTNTSAVSGGQKNMVN